MGAEGLNRDPRLRAAVDGLPPALGPQSVGVVLTNACNLNCVTCWSYSPLRRELPTVDWRRRRLGRDLLADLFADLAALGTERVIFTGGGDPLAHPEYEGIAGDVRAAGLKLTLISNLTLVRDRNRFMEARPDSVLANFSCGDAASYVAFHPGRAPADYEKLLETLRAVAAAGSSLKLVFVVCAVNAHVLGAAVDVAESLGASIQFKRVSVTDETRPLDLTPAHIAALLDDLPRLRARAAAGGVAANWDVLAAELRGDRSDAPTVQETGCWAGHYYSRVTAAGDVFFCCNQHPSLRAGSLHEARFADLWRSAAYQEMRGRLRAGGFVRGCEQCGKMDLNHRVALRARALLPLAGPV